MAYPEQMTLSCGRTEYRGGADGSGNDDGITSRKVEVSVTYRLERRDADLVHAVAVAARELDAAQEVLWQEAQGGSDETTDNKSSGQAELPMGEEADMGEAPTDADAPAYCAPDADDPLASYGYGADMDAGMEDEEMDGSAFGEDAPDDEPPGRTGGANGRWMSPSGSSARQTAGGSTPNGGGSGREAGTDGKMAGGGTGNRPVSVTKPQKLALSALARRLGLSDAAMAEIVKERFGKTSYTPRYIIDRLTKKEADVLLRALAEREWATARPERLVPA